MAKFIKEATNLFIKLNTTVYFVKDLELLELQKGLQPHLNDYIHIDCNDQIHW